MFSLFKKSDKLKNLNSPAVQPVASNSSAVLTQRQVVRPVLNVIDNLEDFPVITRVVSSTTNVFGKIQIPLELTGILIIVEKTTNQFHIVYDPKQQNLIRPYLASFRKAIKDLNNFAANGEDIFCTREIIEKLSANENSTNAKNINSNDQSDGAQLYKHWSLIASKQRGCTDLHIRCGSNGVGLVRMRVNGRLRPIEKTKSVYTNTDIVLAITAAFNMAEDGTNVGGTFRPDGLHGCMIGAKLGIPNIKHRFSTMGGSDGPVAVARILHTDSSITAMAFVDMGLQDSHLEIISKAQRLRSGMIILAGVTGSGKTTFLKSFIETNKHAEELAIYGLYDPIEQPVKYVHQKSIQRDISDSADAKLGKITPYAAHTNQLMRLDPDLIDGGEVRDAITGRALSTIALTGHLSMGTLHTKSISGIVPRLVSPEIGLNKEDLTSGDVLGFLAYLSLAPVLCTCALNFEQKTNEYLGKNEFSEETRLRELKVALTKITNGRIDINKLRFTNECGCEKCDGFGTTGLTMLAEMMLVEDDWRELIKNNQGREATAFWRNKYSDGDVLSSNMNGKLIIENAIYCASKGQIDALTILDYGFLEHYKPVNPK